MPTRDLSRNCPQTAQRGADLSELEPGEYACEFVDYLFPKQGKYEGMINLEGKLRLSIEEDSHGVRTVRHAHADIELGIHVSALLGTKEVPFINGWSVDATGKFALAQVHKSNFILTGHFDSKYAILAFLGDQRLDTPAGSTGADGDFAFHIEHVMCRHARGTVTSAFMDQLVAGLAGRGFEIGTFDATWEVGDFRDDDKLNELIYEVSRIVERVKQSSDPRVRKDAEYKLQQIMQRIGKLKDASLQSCMRRIWFFRGVVPSISILIERELGAIRAITTSATDLATHMSEVLRLTRSLALLGTDRCTEQIQAHTFQELERIVEQLLRALMAEGSDPVNILQIARDAQQIGVISPKLQEQVWAALRTNMRKEVAAKRKELLAHKGQYLDLEQPGIRVLWSALRQAFAFADKNGAYEAHQQERDVVLQLLQKAPDSKKPPKNPTP